MSDFLRIVEVGPRDGLQNEAIPIPTEAKLEFIRSLRAAGLRDIEVTSFVSPKWVPQLGDAAELWPQLPADGGHYSALVPNARGLDRALEVGVERIAVFTAASEAFVQKNLNMSIEESLAGFRTMVDTFRQQRPGGWVRGYVSTIVECPYAGRITPEQVKHVVDALLAMGVDEVSLGETIGQGTPEAVEAMLAAVQGEMPVSRLAGHFHDTSGRALDNVDVALARGLRVFDAAVGGLGGCPYAPGAAGNLATERLAAHLAAAGWQTGLDPERIAAAAALARTMRGGRP